MKLIRPVTVTDSTLTACNVPETDYAAYDAATTYGVGDLIIVAADHKIYESLQAGNVGHTPSSSPTWWLDRGATNRWRMFDALVNSQTIYAGNITFTLAMSGRVNSIAFLNCYAASIRVVATDSVAGTVFDRTVNMQSNLGITDWWSWFFEPPEWNSDAVITDLPVYTDMSLSVTVAAIDGPARVGMVIVGLSKTLGETQYGASVGIQDYSVKTRDTWGNYTVLERAFNKWANFTLMTDNGTIDRLQTLLAAYRAVPCLYIGSEEYGATAVFGFYKDFSVNIQYPTVSTCSIEVEGII